jgi:hypothetical protein
LEYLIVYPPDARDPSALKNSPDLRPSYGKRAPGQCASDTRPPIAKAMVEGMNEDPTIPISSAHWEQRIIWRG